MAQEALRGTMPADGSRRLSRAVHPLSCSHLLPCPPHRSVLDRSRHGRGLYRVIARIVLPRRSERAAPNTPPSNAPPPGPSGSSTSAPWASSAPAINSSKNKAFSRCPQSASSGASSNAKKGRTPAGDAVISSAKGPVLARPGCRPAPTARLPHHQMAEQPRRHSSNDFCANSRAWGPPPLGPNKPPQPIRPPSTVGARGEIGRPTYGQFDNHNRFAAPRPCPDAIGRLAWLCLSRLPPTLPKRPF